MTAHHVPATAGSPVVAPIGQAARAGRAPGRIATLAVLLVTGALVLGAAYLTNRGSGDAGLTAVNLTGTPNGPAPIIGQPAPNISATQADGSAIKLSDLKGSIVWLSFGASWCQPCRAENADVQATYEAFKAKGVVVVQVFMDEDAAAVTDYAGRVGLTYTKVPDPLGRLSTDYRILGIPTHFFIDRDGILRDIKVGTLQAPDMAQILTALGG
jgi:peroxiredoxin